MVRNLIATFSFLVFFTLFGLAQSSIDTIAYQDFENSPAAPVWSYSGTLAGTQSGFASASASIPNTPLGIGGSQAWHVAQVSSGNPITFNNTNIPAGYDSIFVSFHLAGLNLNSSSGGPDNLDYVLVEYSLNGGASFSSRVRVRGAVNNNCSWPYSAASQAVVEHLPAVEQVFQPTNSGVQLQDGISFVKIKFPGNINQLSVKITPRSSSASDSWLIDDLLLTGKITCSNSSASISATTCDSYVAPSGAIFNSSGNYTDIIPNSTGCDSLININLTVNQSTGSTDVISACDSYTWTDGNTYTSSNTTATQIFTNSIGCDSVLSLNLTILNSDNTTDVITACNSYTWIDGNTYINSNNTASVMLANASGCDSVVTLDLTIVNSNTATDAITACDSYTWGDGTTYTSSNTTATQVLTNSNGCDSTVTLDLTILNSSSATDVITACDRYTWIDGVTYTSSNNTAIDTISNQAGCDSIVTLDLTINEVTDAGISINGFTLIANNQFATGYRWLNCDEDYSPVPNATSSTFTPSVSGSYAMEITENGCADTSDCVNVTNVGTRDLSQSLINVFPNPSDGTFSIDPGISGKWSLTVFDLQGRQVHTGSFTGISVFDLTLAKGVYSLTISTSREIRQTLMVVQ